MDSNVVDRRSRCNNSRDSSRVRIVSSVSWCHGMYRKSVPIFPIFPCLLLESHSLLYSSSYLSSSMETVHQLHHHHHHHRQRSWCPAQGAALVPCIEPTFPNSSSDKILRPSCKLKNFQKIFRKFVVRVSYFKFLKVDRLVLRIRDAFHLRARQPPPLPIHDQSTTRLRARREI